MCVLTDKTKQKLIENAVQVFKTYAEFAFFDSPLNALNKKSLATICRENLEKGCTHFSIDLANSAFNIEMATGEAPNKISIKPINKEINHTFPVQSFEQYDEHQKLMLLSQAEYHQFEIDKKGQLRLFNELKPGEKLGGAEHVALYNTHLITLFNIIDKLQKGADVSSLLVALAAGSGKTFVQALWMYVLYLAGVNAVFAVPDKLVDQCKVDLHSILPKAMVDKITCLRKNERNDSIKNLSSESSQVVLASFESLLNHHFDELMTLSADNLFLSFDEQHLLVHKAAWKIKLFALAEKFLTLFLTATPSEQTYNQSGKQPVAVMSNSQKEKAGQGKFPKLYHVEAKMVSEKFVFSTYNPLKSQFWTDLAKKLILKFADTIQEESSSAALTTLEALPNLYSINPNEQTQRFAFEMPFARKMLVITEDNEDIINLFHAIKNSEDILNPMVYRDGNLVDRNEVYDFFMIQNLDEEICRAHRSQYQTTVNQEIHKALEGKQISQPISGINRNVKTQLKLNIMHGLIELLLQDITGLSEIELDQMRKFDMSGLITLVYTKKSYKSADYYYQKFAYHPDTNPRGIDEKGAKDLSDILAAINNNFPSKRYNPELFYSCVNNWTLNLKGVMAHFSLTPAITKFIDDHLMMAVMSDMNDAEMPIKDSVPFMSLEQEQYEFHASPEKAKVRKRTAVETLNDRAVESRFTPQYLEVPETIADNYFRLGLVGMYVSNKKTEGFSDANLHTVINISNHSYSDSNNPQTLVQALGRNRGLNENVTPAFIHGIGKNAASPFKLASLNKDDYYADLYQAQHKFNEIYLDSISQRVSKKIILWINQHNKANDELDEALLKRTVLKFICQAIRELNRANGHDLRISRPQLNMVLSKTMKNIKDEIKHLENPYKLSLFVRVVGTILNFCSELYFQIIKFGPWFKLHWQQWFNRKPSMQQPYDDLYFKILKQSSYKSLVKEASVAAEVNKILQRAKEALKFSLRDNVSDYLNQSTKDEIVLMVNNAIIPSLLKFICDDESVVVHQQLLTIKDWPQVLLSISENHGRDIQDISSLSKFQLIVLFKALLPKLELSESDVVLPVEKEKKLKNYFSSFGPIAEDMDFKKSLIEALAAYFKKTEFAELIKPMFDLSNHGQIAKKLKKNNKYRRALAESIINDLSKLKQSNTPERLIVSLVQKHLQLPKLRTLQDELLSTLQLQEDVNNLVSSSSFSLLDEDSLHSIGNILKKELCPIFVNFYPFEQRDGIYRQAQRINYADFIKTHGDDFFVLLEENSRAAAKLLLSQAKFDSDYALPEQVDEEQEKNRIQKIFSDFSADIQSKSLSHYFYQSITNLNYFNLFQNPQYMTAVEVVNFLRSDSFKSALSFMPYYDAVFLNSLLEDDGIAYEAAYALIDEMCQRDNGESMSPLEMVNLLNDALDLSEKNRLRTNEQLGQQAKEELLQIEQNIRAEPTKYLNKELNTHYQSRVFEHMIPLLCAYIKDVEKQKILINAAMQSDLLGILHRNRVELSELGNQEELTDISKKLIADICNEIGSDDASFGEGDIYAFKDVIEHNIQTIGNEVKVIFLSTYLSSKDCAKQLTNLFNDEDRQSVITSLASSVNDKPISFVLANQILHSSEKNNDMSFLLNDAIDRLKQLAANNELEHVDLLPNRMKSACDYLQRLGGEQSISGNYFSLEAINQAIYKQLLPLLNHELFIKMISSTVGFLTEEEIYLLLSSQLLTEQNSDGIKLNAKLLFEFISAIKTSNVQAIMPFLHLKSDENGSIKLDSSLLPTLVESMETVINCVNDAHCFFEQHNSKGLIREDYRSNFIEQLSDEVKSHKVCAERYNFFDMFTRRIFFIQGVRNGLPNASAMSAFSAQKTIERLNRINNHILRPMWWANNASNLRFVFTKMFADFYEYIVVPTAYFFMNIGISFYNVCASIFSDRVPKPLYERSSQELAYHEAGFSYAKAFNQLNDLTLENLANDPGANDSIEILESFVDTLPNTLEYVDDSQDYDRYSQHNATL